MTNPSQVCIFYIQNDHGIRFLPLHYQSEQHWIYSKHLPILIHQPDLLAGKLPEFEKNPPAQGRP